MGNCVKTPRTNSNENLHARGVLNQPQINNPSQNPGRPVNIQQNPGPNNSSQNCRTF